MTDSTPYAVWVADASSTWRCVNAVETEEQANAIAEKWRRKRVQVKVIVGDG